MGDEQWMSNTHTVADRRHPGGSGVAPPFGFPGARTVSGVPQGIQVPAATAKPGFGRDADLSD